MEYLNTYCLKIHFTQYFTLAVQIQGSFLIRTQRNLSNILETFAHTLPIISYSTMFRAKRGKCPTIYVTKSP